MSEIIYETIKDSDGVDCYIKRGEVVRCEDCEYGQYDCTHMFCDYFGHKVYATDYCSNAVKRREP